MAPCRDNQTAETQDKYCRQIAERIVRELAESDISVSIGIGRYYPDVFMIRQSYLEALMAERSSSFAGASKIVTCAGCQEGDWVTQFREYQHEKETELIDLICAGDWERAREVLDFLWGNIRLSSVGEDLQKASALKLLVVLYRSITRNSNTQQMTALNLSNVKKLMGSNTLQELGDCLYAAVQEIMGLVQTEKGESIGSVIVAVKSYIDQNFSKEITLEDAARHVHISPCYLSRVFSKEEGLPFQKYLKNVKINHAKRLLLSTHKSVQQITFESGYEDFSYFCRAFKQNEGVSPNEYQNQNLPHLRD